MDDQTSVELAMWRDLIESPGWERLTAAVREQWDVASLEGALSRVLDAPDGEALAKLRQMVVARRAALHVLAFPGERVAQLKRAAMGGLDGGRRGAL